MANELKEKVVGSFVWKTAQSVSSLGMTFVIQLVLARMLIPEDFGIIAITTVFMTLANTVVETSFTSSIVQRENIDEKMVSSIFYANLSLSLIVYGVLFFVSPYVALFYDEEILSLILRVQGLRVILSSLYAIPQALLNRKMRFKALFLCSFLGSIGQAIIGFAMAYAGMGVWSLVISTLVSYVISGIGMNILEPCKIRRFFSFELIRESLEFSSKILAIRVIRKIFYNIRILTVGRVYGAEVLGYFNKGFQFPSTAMTVVDGSLTSVAFTSLSKLQNDRNRLTETLRQYVRIIMFICTPLMIGMALVAEPLVLTLLTEKWIKCVPFLQIICFTQILIPLNVKTTAFESLGKSDLSMKLHVSSVIISIALLFITMKYSALIMALSGFVSNLILQIAIMIVAKKELNYKITNQIRDAFCGIVPTAVMTLTVLLLNNINCGSLLKLIIEVACGIVVFIGISIISKNKVFYLILEIVKTTMLRGKKC